MVEEIGKLLGFIVVGVVAGEQTRVRSMADPVYSEDTLEIIWLLNGRVLKQLLVEESG